MGGFSSVYIGMSGLSADSQWLTNIGSNIANMNTVAFKSSSTTFADLVRGSLAGGGNGADGMGVAVSAPQLNFSQGSMSQSSNPMDWAIDGSGFFEVKDAAGNNFYTRDGQFKLQAGPSFDRITDVSGHVLQGFQADDKGAIGDTLGDVQLDTTIKSKATTTLSMALNLNSSATIPTGAFDPTNSATYDFSASQTIYDTRSGVDDVSHTMTSYFVKTDTNTWDIHMQVDGGPVSDAGQFVFNTTGALISGATQAVTVAVPIPGTPTTRLSQSLTLDFTGTTQYGESSGVIAQSQDGYNQGRLNSVSLTGNGIITGNFSNQQQKAVAQVELASFNAPGGLRQIGQGLFVASQDSGAATTFKPDSGGTSGQPSVGQARSNMLELSNVELTNNFVDMMAAQAGFQANSKAITTADEALQTAIGLKR
ncbi:MAG: flagellar hook protein FlgE [Nitrospirota bacterium]|nr:flagellar hook protein FlgE [Nitrospirota bacterium]MDE3243057.1 flagellar hook protein FlgE [Nitrospirota bacterium]